MALVTIPAESVELAEKIKAELIKKGYAAQVVGKNPPAYQKLPRLANGAFCKTFKTTEHTYTILPPGEGISFERYGELYKLLLFKQTGVTNYDDLKGKLEAFMEEAVSVAKQGENRLTVFLIQKIGAAMDANKDILEWQYDVSDYLASIFIVRQDEDLATWNRTLAEQKIADWNAHKYDRNDFFLLSMPLSVRYLKENRELAEKLNLEVYRQ